MDRSPSKPRLREQVSAVMRVITTAFAPSSLTGTGFAISSAFIGCAIRWRWELWRSAIFLRGWRGGRSQGGCRDPEPGAQCVGVSMHQRACAAGPTW